MLIDYVEESGMPGSFGDKDVSTGGPQVIPEDGNYSALPSPCTSSCALPPSQSSLRPNQQFTDDDDPPLSVERSSKVRVEEILRRPATRLSQIHTFLYIQRSKMESRRVRAALENRETTVQQYEHDKAVLLQKAAAYERQLQELSASYAATQREFRDTIDNRLREIASLKEDLGKKDSAIEGVELRCDELNVALTMVREELKEERDKSKAEREQEMRDLETRLMSSIVQVRHQLF